MGAHAFALVMSVYLEIDIIHIEGRHISSSITLFNIRNKFAHVRLQYF
jgi:hypothetical protein